jgi:hypothetical protein
MEYWSGIMNAPIEADWVCETCGQEGGKVYGGFTWGLVNGVFRCDNCHTQYTVRYDGSFHMKPMCMLKEEYKIPIRQVWEKYHVPISEMTDDMIDEFMKVTK